MKRIAFLVALFITAGTISFAQSDSKAGTSSSTPFQKGSNLLSLSMGVGHNSYFHKTRKYQEYNNGRLPIFALTYENGISERAGIGFISLGGELGYTHGKQYDNRFWASEADIYHFGIRSNYHFDWHMLTKEPIFEKLDIYAGLGFFFRFENRYATEDTNDNFDPEIQYTSTEYVFDAVLGARYFIAPHGAIMLQFGSGVSAFSLGGSLMF